MSDPNTNKPVARNPFGDIDPFGALFRSPERWPRLFREPFGQASEFASWAPPLEIVEGQGGYSVTLELPGTKPEDVTVESHESMLTIKGEKRSEIEEKDEHRHYTERSFGSFSRSVRLPEDASQDVKASFKDGVLQIRIPKSEERKPKIVAIES
mgnify:FL=1